MVLALRKVFRRSKEVMLPSGTFAYMMSFAGSFILGGVFTFESRRYLPAVEFGILSLLLAWTQIALSIVNFGFYTSSVTRLKPDLLRPVKLAMLTSRFTTSLLVLFACIAFIISGLLTLQSDYVLFSVCAIANLSFTACTPLWTLQVSRQYRLFNLLVLLQRLLFYLPSVFMLSRSMGLGAVALAWAISPIPVFVYYWYMNQELMLSVSNCFRFPRRLFKTIKSVARHEGSFMASDMVGALVTSLPLLILASSASLKEVGAFAFLDRMKGYAVTIASPIYSAQFNQMASLCSKKEFNTASILMSRFIAVTALMYGLMSCLLWIAYDELIKLNSDVFSGLPTGIVGLYVVGLPIFAVSSCLALVYYSSQRLMVGQVLTYLIRIVLIVSLFFALKIYVGALSAMASSVVLSEAVVTVVIFRVTKSRSCLRFRIR